MPLTKNVMKQASQILAEARSKGLPTADNKNIDADIIIVSQVQLLKSEYPDQYIVIVTTNVKQLERFTQAKLW